MGRATRAGLAAAVVTAGVLAGTGPAAAQGTTVGGVGTQYFLNDAFTGKANIELSYGEYSDEVYVGDWDGNGTDTLLVRRGNTFYARNSATSGPADVVFSYGDPGDAVLVGDWDGNGSDTLAVRRGSTFFVKNSVTTGRADTEFVYGDPGDTVLVGDWDGRGGDTLVVRRGGRYFVKNDLSTGVASSEFSYGDPGDAVLVGRWSGAQAGDTLGVRRGATYFLRNSLTSGVADRVLDYGEPTDTAFSGDWNGDRIDTLGVRRGAAAPPPPPPPGNGSFGDGTYRIGADVAPGTYRASATTDDCYWERVSGFGGSLDEIIANGIGSPEIVTIEAGDAGFESSRCGTWQPLASTYPPAPQTVFGSGTFQVGTHIAAGTYRADGVPDDCYWERLSNFSREGIDGVITNDVGSTIVTISASDAGFSSARCGTWTRTG
ncbi:hypothetical protein [Geodermatophilus sp. DSM 44513]|uniref:hypothetical protein n=1 Tax=Geodermatophilus sp. DSM 44513 TaxID=1528104 RepID=UPI0012808440|nr:hypothetical protein [Geodermatophilus sp. DSM 44513]WNV74763.1 hypothetical protein RTG05_17465 [Geodermatophilus sp. DSM 44513]